MRKVNRALDRRRSLLLSLIVLTVVVADQLSKAWVRTNLPEGGSLFRIGFFRITHLHNTGAAFGLFQDHSFALTIIAIMGIILILVCVFILYRRLPLLDSTLVKVGLGLALGGTTGNLIDRLCFGYVTDFIDFHYWPAFNVADSAVTVGAIIFACVLLRLSQVEKH